MVRRFRTVLVRIYVWFVRVNVSGTLCSIDLYCTVMKKTHSTQRAYVLFLRRWTVSDGSFWSQYSTRGVFSYRFYTCLPAPCRKWSNTEPDRSVLHTRVFCDFKTVLAEYYAHRNRDVIPVRATSNQVTRPNEYFKGLWKKIHPSDLIVWYQNQYFQ